ncbi:helix-turn-helix transcriptional regulator [Streptomyces apricus]|uniref:helix-turn-helix transcriptional regulator n=1 Tax=Streptomyces apricus TaxID=1828112 RepID=UPI001F185D64|nr:helix-turn-helix transcriptional regulator [Streptomyces apricus]
MTGRTKVRQSPPQRPGAPVLHGRGAELAALTALMAPTALSDRPGTALSDRPGLDRSRADRPGADGPVLVLSGDPGLGRSALMEHAARSFDAGPVLRVRASRAESGVALGGAHALRCAAAGLPGGAPADVPGLGAAPSWMLHLLTTVAAGTPLLVCVDDVHLWDTPSRAALGFAARRLHPAGPVRLLLTVARQHAADPDLAALPVRTLAPLSPSAADALLDDTARGHAAGSHAAPSHVTRSHTARSHAGSGAAVDPAVREELLEEAQGNPALLCALVARLSPAHLSGEQRLPRPLADAETLRDVAGAHLAGLSAEASDLLLLVAAAHEHDPEGADAELIRRAAALPSDGRRPTPTPDLLVLSDGRFRFTSPLLRRAVHVCAPPERRRAAHRALASALEAQGHELLALLHRGWSVTGHDPPTAYRLAAAAGDPGVTASRGQRSMAYARAAELTADARERAERLTAAAEQALLAGRARTARRLTECTGDSALPAVVRGRAARVRGILALRDGPATDAGEALLLARSLLAADDPGHALLAGLAAAEAAWATGDDVACLHALNAADRTAATATTTAAAEHKTADHEVAGPARDYLNGMRAMLERDPGRAIPWLRRVVAHAWDEDGPERLLWSGAAALLLGDVPTARRIGARTLAAARSRGPESSVPRALELLAYAELRTGQHALARAHAEEGLRTAHLYGQGNVAAHHHAVLALAASIADEPARVAHHADAALDTARRHGLRQAATLAEWASGRAELGRGRPFEAAARLGPLVRPGPDGGHFAVRMLVMPCYVEAAALTGRRELLDEARAVVGEFALWAHFGADAQAPAQLARCRALVADADRADALYEDALTLHERAGGDFEQARTRLLYGKWLRRRRRLQEARTCLRAALVAFERCGARIWADQAQAELRANGAAPSAPGAGALDGLTPQQLRIARCVAEGATNREVALRLAVSTRTVDYHLRKVFAVLGVRSRVELSRRVEQAEQHGTRVR